MRVSCNSNRKVSRGVIVLLDVNSDLVSNSSWYTISTLYEIPNLIGDFDF
ncbi:hypothetical protein SLEP1_g55468 [Rubroshorea leprosula]|uniref:Uncharacterized protein n=1 Tax=Rubroshorea leprosula TaxID=152421 RepID=A0AAV5MJA8_9ROSI|nr:hypothetical protein SLEP1_g55468 [Rubroshorea leprosula]